MKKRKLALLVVTIVSLSALAKDVDMSDPTAVYSSVGGTLSQNYGANGEETNGDVSVGVGWGKNLLSIESKDSLDSINTRYARMGVVGDLGVYFDNTITTAKVLGEEEYHGYTASLGAIYSLKLNDTLQLYPIVTIGSAGELGGSHHRAIYTVGSYNRIQLGNGWSVGLDPFYTVVDGEKEDSFKFDTFVSYQYKSHQFRLGTTNQWQQAEEYDYSTSIETGGEVYFKYKYAF
ncbi:MULTISPECIES: hypothetical protein [Vibrio]|uniref:Outer membrane protein beta-barrel domain-containing protein n=1 Tax=Vibrio qingdaonensis TaxID=2829491 RepID=A0A9X3CSQ7_9VIBR|nr:hypothetical protein [Vibrio qingdaonensis]MCW8348988.1 hypothetical protein [Vibrio qingdaonensis]